ncbi:hypothetical protein [Paenibacillus sp. FSL R10-2734]
METLSSDSASGINGLRRRYLRKIVFFGVLSDSNAAIGLKMAEYESIYEG